MFKNDQYYLAFVTKMDIPRNTELTIDYDPQGGEVYQLERQRKGKGNAGPGFMECRCGEEDCRGRVKAVF